MLDGRSSSIIFFLILKVSSLLESNPMLNFFRSTSLVSIAVTLLSLMQSASTVFAQTWSPLDTLDIPSKKFQVDALENVYAMTDDYIEVLRRQDGRTFRSSFLEYGSNYLLDLTNPLKPFLFYPDQGIALFLDNMLSFQGETVRWQEMGFEQIELMAGSRGDHFWLWDGLSNELIRVNKQLQVQQRTGELSARLGMVIRPIQIMECGDDVCVVTESGDVLVLDLFGAYRSRFQIPQGSRLLGFKGAVVVWQQANAMHLLDIQTWAEEVVGGMPAQCVFECWQSDRWYARCGKEVVRYALLAKQ